MLSSTNYRRIELLIHTMKIWERVVVGMLGRIIICLCFPLALQHCFMLRKSTTGVMFALF